MRLNEHGHLEKIKVCIGIVSLRNLFIRNKEVECLPVLVSGSNGIKLLGIPELSTSKTKKIGEKVA